MMIVLLSEISNREHYEDIWLILICAGRTGTAAEIIALGQDNKI